MENARKITLFFENKQIRAGTLGNIHVHELIHQKDISFFLGNTNHEH